MSEQTIDNGGPAFPLKEPLGRDSLCMTLRDYFAAKAMFALSAQELCWRYSHKDAETAKRCYDIADAMLKAREGGAA